MADKTQTFHVAADQAGKTIAALLRLWMPDRSWTQVRKLIDGRHVHINGDLWLDEARRLKEHDVVVVHRESSRPPADHVDKITLRHIDTHVVVVEKPSGLSTVRHPSERSWLEPRRLLVPTLDDLVMRQIGMQLPRQKHEPKPKLRIVQRLDKETSGLLVFARTVDAERGLGIQFRQHTVKRRYLALVQGRFAPQVIRSVLVRDRGDGRRGSTELPTPGKEAITHVSIEEQLPHHTLLSCRLETGRTHQIRIHLSEKGTPVCGEKVYNRRPGGEVIPDSSNSPRLFLHATELGFVHPVTEEPMHWEMPLPFELRELLAKLRG